MLPELITTSSQMDTLTSQLEAEPIIAVDTEFQRETSYYPHLALVQIATSSIVACIDPIAFDAREALKKLLLNKNITKIFHACSQDLEVLYYYLGEAPTPVYDTQIANALLTDHHQIGYASLVENELGVQLDKSQTRTNWLQRPLTEKQIKYAGDDVIYLYQLHTILDKKLNKSERTLWFDEETAGLVSDEDSFKVNIKQLWKRVKGASKLQKSELAIIQAIAQWREQLAQLKDRTRRRVLPDDLIIQLALSPPESTDALGQVLADRYNFSHNEKSALNDAIQASRNCVADECPVNKFSVLDGQQKNLLKALQQAINSKAEQLGISSAIICSRKDLEKLILNHTDYKGQTNDEIAADLNILQGWRLHCIGHQLLETVRNHEITVV